MKRLPVPAAALFFSAAAILACLAALTACAGRPEAREEGLSAEAVAEAFDDAGNLLVLGTPSAVEACAERMSQAGLPQPEASELSALAGSFFRLLYPEIKAPAVLPSADAYNGPYQPALADAARGAPPRASWSAPAIPEAAGAGESVETGKGGAETPPEEARSSAVSEIALMSFLNRVVPALYLARLGAPSGDGYPGVDRARALEAGLEAARQSHPRSVLPPYLLGRLAELSGRSGAAVELYRGCLALAGEFYPARQRLAAVYLAGGQGAQAANELEGLRAEFPEEASLRDSLIRAYLLAAEPEKASPLVAKALMENPESREHLLLRAEILLREGDWSQALKPLTLLLRSHPEAREGYLLTARVKYEHAHDVEGALEVIRQAETRFPEDPEFPELAGVMLLAENRSDEGLEQLKRALEREPGRLSTLRLVAAEAMSLQRWAQARRYLDEILAQEQTVQDLRDAYHVAVHLGDRASALSYAEKIYGLEKNDEARIRYAGALLNAGKDEEARRLIDQGLEQQGLEQPRDPKALSSLLYLQARLQEDTQPEAALRALQRAVMADPENGEAVRRLAELYFQRGQLREARLFFRAAVQQNPGDEGLKVQLEQVENALEQAGTAGDSGADLEPQQRAGGQ
jgi:tetratricopeptide (TPR) repeat protein